jgi:hypothetical protein
MTGPPRWPSFWPRRPTADDAASACALHPGEVIAWWASSPIDMDAVWAWLHGPYPPVGDPGPFTGWTPEDRDRLVGLADVLWAIGRAQPETRELAERVAMEVCAAEYAAGVAHLARLAASLTPLERASALFLRSSSTGPIGDERLVDAIVENTGEAIARRFESDPRIAGAWLSIAPGERVAAAVARIEAGIREIEVKLRHRAGGTRASRSGCLSPSLVAMASTILVAMASVIAALVRVRA